MGVAEEAAQPYLAGSPFVARAATWRSKQEPPTAAQLDFARRLGIKLSGNETKASLSDLIDERMAHNMLRRAKFDSPM